MPRNGGLSEPTSSDAAASAHPAASLAPPRRPARASDATATAERPPKRKSGFLTFALASLVVALLLALIGWQADPQMPQQVQGLAERAQAALGLANAPAPQPQTTAPAPTAPPSVPAVNPAPAATGDNKPSPIPPQATVAATGAREPEHPAGGARNPGQSPRR